ncbi:sodium/bile acid cotransporter 7 [Mesonia hippocampi]|uniref:Sodium/bile acid cotransporter 7 n=1 Tax=Mesonia hippocampi TaxID=1628250 RepID=A0A840EJJ5_9FLAO|nr:bile acid:sodium symporter family protein [Mesonia hippocampi]MBB4119562.1 sodium/bile acid cotransporter 7 [Mesonia hippocampi]
MKANLFVGALILTIIFSYFFPNLGSYIPLNTITDIGIGFIFFFYGLKLSVDELKRGMQNNKLHVLIQSFTFFVFPLTIFVIQPFSNLFLTPEVWLAFFFLACLPSTVSSSVVMVSIAKGNIPAAIFNASISGILGIFLTPFYMSFFLKGQTDFSFSEVLIKLFLQIIIPLILGFLLRHPLEVFVNKYRTKLSLIDKMSIILIVYNSFSLSFNANIFEQFSIKSILIFLLIVGWLFFGIYFLISMLSKKLGFSEEDQITAKFCGTKKSLVHGSAMAKVMFSGQASMGLFLTPIMLYHIFQLIVVAIFAEKYNKENSDNT